MDWRNLTLGIIPKPVPAMSAEERAGLQKTCDAAREMALFDLTGARLVIKEWVAWRREMLVDAFASGPKSSVTTEEIRGRLLEITEFERWLAAWPERGGQAMAKLQAAQGKS